MTDTLILRDAPAATRPPRVGFLGVGWIGRHRMEALIEAGAVEVVGVADAAEAMLDQALALAPGAAAARGLDELLDLDLDGLVIATPSALHASQAIAALERGVAVFCQKPLGRSEAEVAQRGRGRAARRSASLGRPVLSPRRGHAPGARGGAQRRDRPRLPRRPDLPQRLRTGQAVVLRSRPWPAAAA
jgi:hypothetical protein